MNETGRRFYFETITLTRWQRTRWWWRAVWGAICQAPEKTVSVQRVCLPGSPQYEKAPLIETLSELMWFDLNKKS